MSDDWLMVIPSMGRADRVKTLALLPPNTVSLVVPEAEAEAYKTSNPTAAIIAHPDDLIGLPLKRQWIMDQFGTHISLDDDLAKIYDATQKKERKLAPDEAHGRLQRLADELHDLDGVYLAGLSKEQQIMRYDDGHPYRLTGFVCFSSFVWKAGSKLWLHADSFGQDDFWMSAMNAYYHRMALIDLRLQATQTQMYVNPGGLVLFRSEAHNRTAETLFRRSFGDEVSVEGEGAKNGLAYSRKFKLPF